MKFAKKIIKYNLVELLVIFLGFIYSIYTARVFDVEDIGKYAIILSVVAVICQINSVGTPTWFLIRYKNRKPTSRIISSYVQINIFLSVLVPFVFCLLCIYYDVYQELTSNIWTLFLYTFFVSIKALLRPYFLIRQDTKSLSMISISGIVSQISSLLVFVILGFNLTYSLLFYSFTFSAFFRAISSILLLTKAERRDIFSFVEFRLSRKLCYAISKQSVKININDTLIIMILQLPYFIANYLRIESYEIGVFNRANQLALLFNTAIQSIFPLVLSYWLGVDKNNKIKQIFSFSIVSTLIFILVSFSLHNYSGEVLSTIYGEQYANGGDILIVSLFLCLCFINYKLLNNYLLSEKKVYKSVFNSCSIILFSFLTCHFTMVGNMEMILYCILFAYFLVIVYFYLESLYEKIS